MGLSTLLKPSGAYASNSKTFLQRLRGRGRAGTLGDGAVHNAGYTRRYRRRYDAGPTRYDDLTF